MYSKAELHPDDYAVPPEIYDKALPQIATAKTVLTDFLSKDPLSGQETVLDFGCGTGLLAEHVGTLLSTGHTIGLDCAGNMIKFANEHHASDKVSFEIEDLTRRNPQRKKTADLILCSWVISHIPSELQKTSVKNFFNYLKKDGKLLIIFPVMGSSLATIINEVANSTEWKTLCDTASKRRVSYSTEEYDRLLEEAGFINRQVQTQVENFSFGNKEELDCFITTAVARYLPCLNEESVRLKFIQTISEKYCLTMGATENNIPYTVTLLTATAQRPNLTYLLQQTNSPIYKQNRVELSPTGEISQANKGSNYVF